MTTSDSEEFESADESVEANSLASQNRKGQLKNSRVPNLDSKKVSLKEDPSSGDAKETGSATGNSQSAKGSVVNNCEQSDSLRKVVGSIDEEKVFDMFDDKTMDRPLNNEVQQKSGNVQRKQNQREPRQTVGARKLGSKMTSKPQDPAKDTTVEPKIECSRVASEAEKSEKLKTESSVKQDKSTIKKHEGTKLSNLTNVDGWELEDGFEVPVSNDSKPKHEEFEKELFPVLNKLSSLTTNTKNDSKVEERAPSSGGDGGGGAGSGWSGWGGWGMSSILTSATESVSTLSSHVSAGFNTVLETGLGAPDPETLAEALEKEKLEKEKEKELKDTEEKTPPLENRSGSEPSETTIGFSGLGQLMSGVSQLGTKVLTGGLDTLETLGKKTMEVLQDGDPGLRKKRALFFQDEDKPVLSQILREAKETAEKSDKLEEEKQAAKRVHLETLFDDYQGLVHLEALEMLSNQCQLKLQSILLGMTGEELKDLQETLEQVKELCELPDEEEDDDKDDDIDFKDKLTDAIDQLCKDVPHSKIFEVSQRIEEWLKSEEAKSSSPITVHEKAVASMAEFTSVSIEIFHRAAELLLIKLTHSTATEAECLTQITTILCIHVSRMATKFTMLFKENSESKENNRIITTIFMESSQCSSYIQDACRLVVPVLQVGAAK